MTIDKQKLKALAEAATQSHGARRVEVDHNGVHVIGDGSWKILSAWHTPDGKGAQNAEFAAAASPATILALLAEIERLERDARNDAIAYRAAIERQEEIRQERDQLKAENEALRKDAERYRWLRRQPNDCSAPRIDICHWTRNGDDSVNEGEGLRGPQADEAIDAAMAKEASHG